MRRRLEASSAVVFSVQNPLCIYISWGFISLEDDDDDEEEEQQNPLEILR